MKKPLLANRIIITEIPYQLIKPVIERIADLPKTKPKHHRLREKQRKGMWQIIETRRDVNSAVILNNLYKHTQLQNFLVLNMIALDAVNSGFQ